MKDNGSGSGFQDLSEIEIREDHWDDDDGEESNDHNAPSSWTIPLPSRRGTGTSTSHRTASLTTATPLLVVPVRRQQRRALENFHGNIGREIDHDDLVSTSLLFGDLAFLSPSSPRESRHRSHYSHHDAGSSARHSTSGPQQDALRPKGLAGWLFGFMYEDVYNDSFDFDDDAAENDDDAGVWNPLNVALFATYALTSAAATLPVLLIPTISQEFVPDGSDTSAFASRAAASTVLGIACGKFVNGPFCDVMGARRTSTLYSILMAVALTGLSVSRSATFVTGACFFVDFFQSVQWPSIIVILATHYSPPKQNTMYESGIYLTSIASRFGALLGIPIFSMLLRRWHWRVVCLVGAWIALIGSSVMYLFIRDSPLRVDHPQNALHPALLQQMATLNICTEPQRCLIVATRIVHSIFVNNLLPGFNHVLKSGTFWIVALAHTGSSMIRSSERILGTYFHDTSFGYLSDNQAGSLVVFLSLGTIWGLAIAGKMFGRRKERQRKWLVSRLYVITIGGCYSLAILAVPRLRRFVDSPDLILFFQIVASFAMGFGISVTSSMIPGLVGSAFANHKGFYTAYTDGVAYGLSSMVWRIVANAVENGNADGGGWAYGWAAVALLIVLCSILMLEFMEHYFVRPSGRHHGTYETIIFA
jgi:MFS family permease